MLPSFVIGLREGLEAALIVGIVAAFLVRQGRRDAVRQVWLGVAAAVALCLALGLVLDLLERSLPQRGQEALETVIGLVAVGLVTTMIVWMRRHARTLKSGLESAACRRPGPGLRPRPGGDGVPRGAARGPGDRGLPPRDVPGLAGPGQRPASAPSSASRLRLLLGYALYRGGTRINLQRFFTLTSVVLVVVAAGLLMTAAHTAHEAGWLDVGQATALDLHWLVRPGTPWSAVVTGVLGIQPRPTVVEVVVWALYLAVMLTVVLRPGPRPPRPVQASTTTSARA